MYPRPYAKSNDAGAAPLRREFLTAYTDAAVPLLPRIRDLASFVLPLLRSLSFPLLALFALTVTLEIWLRAADVSKLFWPRPTEVVQRLWTDRGLLASEGAWTVTEAVLGFLLGTGIALLLAVPMALSRRVEHLVMPFAIWIKVTPFVAVAPLLIVWLGFGLTPKIVLAAMIVFYTVLVNAVIGFRAVNPNALAFLESLNASRLEVFWALRLPSALPFLISALRSAITLSLIGAVVAEYFGASHGLGRLINVANSNLDLAGVFSGVAALALLGIGLTWLVSLAERRLLFWHESFTTH